MYGLLWKNTIFRHFWTAKQSRSKRSSSNFQFQIFTHKLPPNGLIFVYFIHKWPQLTEKKDIISRNQIQNSRRGEISKTVGFISGEIESFQPDLPWTPLPSDREHPQMPPMTSKLKDYTVKSTRRESRSQKSVIQGHIMA